VEEVILPHHPRLAARNAASVVSDAPRSSRHVWKAACSRWWLLWCWAAAAA